MIKNTENNIFEILLQFEGSSHYFALQSHDPSVMLIVLAAQETFLIIAAYFYGNHNTLPKQKKDKKKINIQQGCIK